MIDVKATKITSKSPFEKFLKENYGQNLNVGWLSNKKRREPNFNIKKNGSVGKGGQAEEKTFDVIRSLEKGGRKIFSKPTRDFGKIKKVIDILKKGFSGENIRALNLAKSIFQEPMLKGRYKKESPSYLKVKGFSRPTILTKQTLESIEGTFNKNEISKMKVKKGVKL